MSEDHLQFGYGVDGVLGISREARRQHCYIVGKTGTGKTTLLANLILQDMRRGDGVTVIDPHGQLAQSLLPLVPKNRTRDVVFFNPHDTEFPSGLNILQEVPREQRTAVMAGALATFSHIFNMSPDTTPRLLHFLRNGLLALLDAPDTNLASLLLLYSDKKYRARILKHVTNPIVEHFWNVEFATNPDKYNREALGPIFNRIESFLVYEPILHILGQKRSTINFREIIDERKIFIADLSKGLLGEEPTSLLGSFIVTQLELAAMTRIDTPEEERIDHYIYIDEIHNYSTSSFANFYAEARKMRTPICTGFQITSQLDEDTRNAILGNAGTVIVFQVATDDARYFMQELEPMRHDELTERHRFTAWIKRPDPDTIQRRHLNTFEFPKSTRDPEVRRRRVIDSSRQSSARPLQKVQEELAPLLKQLRGEG